MTVLVTGATGFIGSAVARRALAAGADVRVLARPGGDRRNLAGLKVEIVEGDLRRPESLAAALDGCRALFHVAADYRFWVPDPAELYRANVDGTLALMRAAAEAGVERIVYTSSVATLGIPGDGTPGDEATPVDLADMIGAYKRSKFLAEARVRALATAGLPAVIVNPSAPVGPRDVKPTPTGRIIVDAAAGRMPAFVDTGLNIVHVEDCAEGHWLAFERGRPGERYVLGGEDLSLRQILGIVADLTGRPPPRIRLPHRPVMGLAHLAERWARLTGRPPFATVDELRMAEKHMFFSSAKAAAELGYRARPAREAIGDAVAWFRAAGYLERKR
ncbi:MAG: NAD-dependent epimerase/dehydratase family protein [Dongiaceae bacterium]